MPGPDAIDPILAYLCWVCERIHGDGYARTVPGVLNHGEIEISNNQVENAIRPIVVGRKNWLFCDTQAGANASVVIFSLLETAKANGLNPEAYLNHLLTVLPERFNADPHASVDDLLPWSQEMQRAFMPEISDVDH